MKREPLSIRGLLVILIAGLVLSSTGCITGERRANRSLGRIAEGMSQEDVLSILGGADRVTQRADKEIWHYSYGSLPDPRQIAIASAQVLAVLTIFGAYFVMIAYAGHGSGGEPDFRGAAPNFGSPEVHTGSVHFRVVFNRAGRVITVSGIEAGNDDSE
jgi:hypothetical protein